jgi:FkbM family methyltransferase
MFNKLELLKHMGYVPDTILDIGAHHGHWTNRVKQIFGNSRYYLFEGIDYDELKQLLDVSVYNVILNDKVEEINWYQMKNTGDSMFREKTFHFKNCKPIIRETIDFDTLMQGQLDEATNILIKIDCQGAEIPILKGATSIYSKTDFILLEIPFFGQYNEGVPNFLEHIQFMDEIGFVPYDIYEAHFINGFNMQVDMMFINKNHSFNTIVNQLTMSLGSI